jgi:hypothetical protein
MNCSSCNAGNQTGNFCNQCGAELAESKKSCQHCGNKEILGEFCHKCGSPVTATNECKNCNATGQTGRYCRKCGSGMTRDGDAVDFVAGKPSVTCSKCGNVSDRYDEHGYSRIRCESCGAGSRYIEWTES